ncbi:MAG: hypothetical protein QM705_03470 [Ancrocorticia sp.]
MNTGRVTRWSRIATAGSMATAMMITMAACSSYTPRAHEEPAASPEVTASAAPGATQDPTAAPGVTGVTAEQAQALLATVDCAAGADPFDFNWRNTLPIFAGSGIAAAGTCSGDPSAITTYDGDLAELAVLLARPDDTTPLAEGTGCDNYYEAQPNLWIVTTEGTLMQPRWPLDNCSHLLQPVPPQIMGWSANLPGASAAVDDPAALPEEQAVPEEQPVYEEPVYEEYVEEPVSE